MLLGEAEHAQKVDHRAPEPGHEHAPVIRPGFAADQLGHHAEEERAVVRAFERDQRDDAAVQLFDPLRLRVDAEGAGTAARGEAGIFVAERIAGEQRGGEALLLRAGGVRFVGEEAAVARDVAAKAHLEHPARGDDERRRQRERVRPGVGQQADAARIVVEEDLRADDGARRAGRRDGGGERRVAGPHFVRRNARQIERRRIDEIGRHVGGRFGESARDTPLDTPQHDRSPSKKSGIVPRRS